MGLMGSNRTGARQLTLTVSSRAKNRATYRCRRRPIRTGDQPQDRKGARPHRSNVAARARRRDNRMNVGMSAIGTKRTSLVAPHMSAFGVERTSFRREMHLCLRRSGFCNFFVIASARKTRRGKQWGKQIAHCAIFRHGDTQQLIGVTSQARSNPMELQSMSLCPHSLRRSPCQSPHRGRKPTMRKFTIAAIAALLVS